MRIIGLDMGKPEYRVLCERLQIEPYPLAVGLATLSKKGSDVVIIDVHAQSKGLVLARDIRAVPYGGVVIGLAPGKRRSEAEQDEEAMFLALGGDRLLSASTSPVLLEQIVCTLTQTKSGEIGYSPAPKEIVCVEGRVRVDPEKSQAYVDGKAIQLTSKEFLVLMTLAQRAGRFQTREQLMQAAEVSLDAADRSIDSYVKRIRAKANDTSIIKTQYGRGYCVPA